MQAELGINCRRRSHVRMCDEHDLKHVHGMPSSEIKKTKSDQSATCVENLQRIETTIAVLHVL